MRKRKKTSATFEAKDVEVTGEKLEPVGTVRRELVSPDGSTVVVDVPVYPPFRLADRSTRPSAKAAASRDGRENAA